MPPILTDSGLSRWGSLRGHLIINGSITPLVYFTVKFAPNVDNSCPPDFPSALQEPLHATFQRAGCKVGSDSRSFRVIVQIVPGL